MNNDGEPNAGGKPEPGATSPNPGAESSAEMSNRDTQESGHQETPAADHRETIHACGHENVAGTHASTLELTTDDWLTPAGDCIVGVDASAAPADFAAAFTKACQNETATIEARLSAGDQTECIVGAGHPALEFTNERSLVIRTSDYVDDRTVMIEADKAAGDLDRSLVEAISSGADVTLELTVWQ